MTRGVMWKKGSEGSEGSANEDRCIHEMASGTCAVCSGYVRWLIAGEERLRRAQAGPEAVRREYGELDYEIF